MPTRFHANMYVPTSVAYILPTSTGDVLILNVKSCIKSSQSSAIVPSVSSVCLTPVHHNGIKKLM